MNKVLGYICAALLLVSTAGAASAQADEKKGSFFRSLSYDFGVHTGIDIGAAVPWPPNNMGGGMKMNATPYLAPELGFSGTAYIDPRWSVTLEATYKRLGVDAKARVDNQKFRDPDDPTRRVNFRGTTEIEMRFSMIEVPLYAGYSFGKNQNRVVLGLYFSRVVDSKFRATPKKGVMTSLDDPNDWMFVTPESDNNATQNFDDNMDNWDLGFLVGWEFRVMDRVQLGLRYSMGFKDIFRPDARFLDYNMLNMRGSLVLSYKMFKIK